MFQTIARFLPGSLIRRWLAVREAEAVARKAEADREIIMEEVYNAGWRACERKLTGASA